MAEPAPFDGFPVAALDFYDDLEQDNTRSFWAEHREVYERSVRDPMTALVAALEPEFGPAKVFRPYRDVRFAKDKTPYKTHQGALVQSGPATGWYVEVAAPGVSVAVGFYHPEPGPLAAIRRAVAEERTGRPLRALVTRLQDRGWELGGESLRTTPRGYRADHPRIDLLRHKTLTLRRSYGFEPVVHTAGLLDLVREDWRAGRPFVEWVGRHVT